MRRQSRPRGDAGDRQPALALVAPGTPVTDKQRGDAARKIRLGRAGDDEMWLDWRIDRQQYCVGYYDRAARTGRRKLLGIGAGPDHHPPRAACEALAAHYAARARPAAPLAAADVGVSTVLTKYLDEHCQPEDRPRDHIGDAERQANAVLALERFIMHQVKTGRLVGMLPVSALDGSFVQDFAAFRRNEGRADATIKRELGVLRAAVGWAENKRFIAVRPFIPKLEGQAKLKTRSRKFAYTLPQIAAILEAAWAEPRRQHVHLFALTMLASHARTEAILECDLDLQYEDGVIDWLGPTRGQTKKRRSITPIGPTLAAWLDGRKGKLIRYRVEKARRRWADQDVPEYFELPTNSIDTAFEKTLLAAGAAHPSLKLRVPVLDVSGAQKTRTVMVAGRPGVVDRIEPVWNGVGSPNTFRHTIRTQHRRLGTPIGQVRAAAGHAEQGIDETYTHLDARHDLKDFLAATEQLFDELRAYTNVHLRTQHGPNIVDLGAIRAARSA